MLEHVPQWLGALLQNVRPGHAKLTIVQNEVASESRFLELASPAFADGARLPVRFTANGEGVSPPLVWRGVPDVAKNLAFIVKDADAPTPSPLAHALVCNISPGETRLAEGAISADGKGADGRDVGRNSFFAEGLTSAQPAAGTRQPRLRVPAFRAVRDACARRDPRARRFREGDRRARARDGSSGRDLFAERGAALSNPVGKLRPAGA